MFPILGFPGCPVGAVGRFRCHVGISVWCTLSGSAVVLEMWGETFVWWRSSMWCIPSMVICVWVSVAQCASVWMSVVRPGVFLCELLWLWLLYLWLWEWDLDLLDLCLLLWLWWEVDLSQCLVVEWTFLHLAGVPDGSILSGQSAATWPYSLQSKHFIQAQYALILDTGRTCHCHLT